MRNLLLSGAALALLSGPALAADIPVMEEPAPAFAPLPPADTWTGFYVGLHGGYAFGGDSGEIVYDVEGDGFGDDDDEFFSGDELDGFTIGAKLGYDVQINRFVVGAVADLNYLELETDYDFDDFEAPGEAFTLSEGIDWYATLRGRAGFLITDSLLVYGHGGLAYSNVEFEGDFEDDDPATEAFSPSDDEDLWGWTLGAGVEAAITPNVLVGLEYSYVDLGEGDWEDDEDDGIDYEFDGADIDFHTVRAGVSFKF